MNHPNDDSRRISESVSRALRDAGIPQRTASEQTGIPMTTFVRKVTGKRPFDTNDLTAIANLIGCSLSELMFHGTDDQPTKAAS